MRIAFIGQKGIPTSQGGVERHVEELTTRLVLRGCEVLVYTRPSYVDKNLRKYKGVELISLPSVFTKHLDAITHTFVACLNVRKQNVDIIHFHSIGPSFLIWFAKIINPRTPIIATFHSQCYRHKKWGIFARFSLKLGERICCIASDSLVLVSRNLKRMVLDKYKRNGVYIPNGVPSYETVNLKLAKKWGLRRKEYILFAGRLMESKGVHYLIKAFNLIRTNKKLVIAGDEMYTKGYKNKLEKLASGNDRIIFTGNLDGNSLELAELFSNAYLFVHPSEIEGLSIALLETMSYGVPALVSDIPENVEVIQKAGFTFKNKNTSDLRNKLERLLRDPINVRKKAQEGRARVKEHYSWEAVSSEILDLYKAELKNHQSNKKFPRTKYFIEVLKRNL